MVPGLLCMRSLYSLPFKYFLSKISSFLVWFWLQVCENHPQGVVLVKFKDRKDAQRCIELMHGRW